MSIEKFRELRKNSIYTGFNTLGKTVPLDGFLADSIRWFVEEGDRSFKNDLMVGKDSIKNGGVKNPEHWFNYILNNCVPEFQRSNDKWSKTHQENFIGNWLVGYPVNPIILYRIGDSPAKILDGLQRVTAISQLFLNPSFNIRIHNENILTSTEFFNNCNLADINHSDIRLIRYDLKSEKEAAEIYLKINDGFGHSSKDIQKAKDYLKGL